MSPTSITEETKSHPEFSTFDVILMGGMGIQVAALTVIVGGLIVGVAVTIADQPRVAAEQAGMTATSARLLAYSEVRSP